MDQAYTQEQEAKIFAKIDEDLDANFEEICKKIHELLWSATGKSVPFTLFTFIPLYIEGREAIVTKHSTTLPNIKMSNDLILTYIRK